MSRQHLLVTCKEKESDFSRMKQNTRVHEWCLLPLKELISISPLCSSLLSGCYTKTSSISQSANQIPLLQPAPEKQTNVIGQRVGNSMRGGGEGFLKASPSLSLSPSLCFSLTVCDSSWISDCSHTLPPLMVDHISRLPHLSPPPPHPSDPPSSPGQHLGL